MLLPERDLQGFFIKESEELNRYFEEEFKKQ